MPDTDIESKKLKLGWFTLVVTLGTLGVGVYNAYISQQKSASDIYSVFHQQAEQSNIRLQAARNCGLEITKNNQMPSAEEIRMCYHKGQTEITVMKSILDNPQCPNLIKKEVIKHLRSYADTDCKIGNSECVAFLKDLDAREAALN